MLNSAITDYNLLLFYKCFSLSKKRTGNFYYRILLAKNILYLKVMNPVIQIT